MKILFCGKFACLSRGLMFTLLWIGAGCSSPAIFQLRHPAVSMQTASRPEQLLSAGQRLFLKNCAHCHGANGAGDEGPDLHNLDWSDEQIGRRIRVGKKGQMSAFAGKLSDEDIRAVIAYLRSLR
jgi:cytochrome c oxidase cbb3-type subunit 3